MIIYSYFRASISSYNFVSERLMRKKHVTGSYLSVGDLFCLLVLMGKEVPVPIWEDSYFCVKGSTTFLYLMGQVFGECFGFQW